MARRRYADNSPMEGYRDEPPYVDEDYEWDGPYGDEEYDAEEYDGEDYEAGYAPARLARGRGTGYHWNGTSDVIDPRPGDAVRYVADHNLPLGLLLLLLPPLGVALMWWRRRFRRRGRILVTVLAALWMALLAVLFIVRPVLAARQPAVDVVEEAGDMLPGATNPVIVTDEQLSLAQGVYVSENSAFYHQLNDCRAFPAADEITRVDQSEAVQSGLMACPYCLGGQYTDSIWDLKLVNTDVRDQSGTMVYCSAGNASFHVDPNCQSLGSGGRAVTLQDALLMGKANCDTCCPEAARSVFCTSDGRYYHYEAECSGMRNASLVKLPEALVLGKSSCPVCIKNSSDVSLQTTEQNNDAVYYVYATENGTYYHIKENCSGMKNAQQVSLKAMLASRRPACPVCCPNSEMTVYGERGNPYYHSTDTCSNMTNPSRGTLVEALANGLQRCPVCWVSTSGS